MFITPLIWGILKDEMSTEEAIFTTRNVIVYAADQNSGMNYSIFINLKTGLHSSPKT